MPDINSIIAAIEAKFENKIKDLENQLADHNPRNKKKVVKITDLEEHDMIWLGDGDYHMPNNIGTDAAYFPHKNFISPVETKDIQYVRKTRHRWAFDQGLLKFVNDKYNHVLGLHQTPDMTDEGIKKIFELEEDAMIEKLKSFDEEVQIKLIWHACRKIAEGDAFYLPLERKKLRYLEEFYPVKISENILLIENQMEWDKNRK